MVKPETIIAPYDQTLKLMRKPERQEWTKNVWVNFRPILTPGDEIIILAGMAYGAYLVPMLKKDGFQVQLPLAGLRIGEQLQWLKNHLA